MAKRAGRKPARSTAAVALSNALDFAAIAQKQDGAAYETHSAMWDKWLYSFNGILATGCKIDEDIRACPHTYRLRSAINKAGKTLSITHDPDNNRLTVKSDKFKANVPCIGFDAMPPIVPDPPVALINDNLRTGFEKIAGLASDNAEHVATASILIKAGSMLATDRILMLEYWHGIDLPVFAVPKVFATEVMRIKKPLMRFGFSENSATFYFEDESWIKTQLYREEWPDVDPILNRQPNVSDIPANFFDGVSTVEPFVDEGQIFFRKGVLASHKDENEGIEYQCKVPGDLAYKAKALKLLEGKIDKIDFNCTGDPENPIAYFFGENLRGALAGAKYIQDKPKVPDSGWTRAANTNDAPQDEPFTDDDVPPFLRESWDQHEKKYGYEQPPANDIEY